MAEGKKHEIVIPIPARDNIPLSIFYPEEKNGKSQYERNQKNKKSNFFKTPILETSKGFIISQFPGIQNRDQDCFFCQKAQLKINNGQKFYGAIALTLHFAGFFEQSAENGPFKLRKWVHLFEIYSIRIKTNNKTLLFCRKEKEGVPINENENQPTNIKDEEVINVHINSPYAIEFTQILYRNYMLSTVVYDPDETCDFRTFDEKFFPPFNGNLSPSQAYQLTYFCFCSRLNLPYKHEITRFYHEHICNFDGFFDFGLLSDQTNLIPAIYAMMFVSYVKAIICHEFQIANISQSIELIIRRSNYLRALHLSGCNIDEEGMKKIGKSLLENISNYKKKVDKDISYQDRFPIPIPIRYWNFENNKFSDATDFFKGLKSPTFQSDVFYLSFSNCGIEDISMLFKAISSNPHLHKIKYLYFNGNQTIGKDDMNVFIKHLNDLADSVNNPDRKKRTDKCLYENLGVSGKASALKALFETLIKRNYVIKELSLAGSEIVRKKRTHFYTPSVAAAALIDYFDHAKDLKVIDLSAIRADRQDLSLILQGLNKSEVINRIHVKLNNLKSREDDYEPLLSIGKAFLYTNLEKWESLEFADNHLSSFELDFLLSIFIKMPNLTMLNLNHNFKKSDDGCSQVLEKLYHLKNLTRLYIAGSIERKLYLPRQLNGLLTKLIEIGRLEEIDISGNRMGDKCYEFAIDLLSKCENLNTLIIDQNHPENFILFENVIHRAMKKENLIFFPFPSIDMMNYILKKGIGIEQLDNDSVDQLRWYLINLRYKCNVKINQHRKRAHLPPQLPFKAVKELGEMMDEVNKEMKVLLNSDSPDNPIYLHGCVSKDIHVPLPYLSEKQNFPKERDFEDIDPYCEDPQEILEKYHLNYLFKGINEARIRRRNQNNNDISGIRERLANAVKEQMSRFEPGKGYLYKPDIFGVDDDEFVDTENPEGEGEGGITPNGEEGEPEERGGGISDYDRDHNGYDSYGYPPYSDEYSQYGSQYDGGDYDEIEDEYEEYEEHSRRGGRRRDSDRYARHGGSSRYGDSERHRGSGRYGDSERYKSPFKGDSDSNNKVLSQYAPMNSSRRTSYRNDDEDDGDIPNFNPTHIIINPK